MFLKDLRRFAPIGLWISGIAVLVSFGLYIVQKSFNLPLQISLAMIVVGLALYVFLDPQRTRVALTGRQARYGSNSFLMTVAFIGIVIVINVLVYQNSKQWDFTEDQQNTLTDETVQTLASLPSAVTAEAYYSSRMSPEQARKLLQNYETNSKGKFTFEFIDPEKDQIRANEAGITLDGTIVLKMDGRQEQVSYANEQDITEGLVRLANPGSRAVYFLTGHGEIPFDSSSEVNYSLLQTSLNAKNYTTAPLNLAANPAIPKDALAIIIAGPQKPVTEQEAQLLQEYVDQGGSLVYLSEPRVVTQFGEDSDPLADYLQSAWGITINNDFILDVSQNNNQPTTVISDRFTDHAITMRMYSYVVILPSVHSVQAAKTLENITLTELVQTTENAWGETDIEGLKNNQASPDEAADFLGPVPFAVAGENQASGARVVIIGDSEFASTALYGQLGNADFILNSIDWAAQQDNLISLTPRQPIQRMMLPPSSQNLGLVLLGSVFLLPGLVLFTGIFVWAQRRRRG